MNMPGLIKKESNSTTTINSPSVDSNEWFRRVSVGDRRSGAYHSGTNLFEQLRITTRALDRCSESNAIYRKSFKARALC